MLDKLRAGRYIPVIAFIWGLCEGLFFFIVPDVYVLFVALVSPKNSLKAWGYSILGSLVSVLIFFIAIYVIPPAAILSALNYVPGISTELIQHTSLAIAEHGLPYTPFLVLGGVPLKVYTASALQAGMPLFAIVLWTLFARIVRIAPGFIFISVIAAVGARSIKKHTGIWVTAYAVCWILFYIFYFSKFGFF